VAGKPLLILAVLLTVYIWLGVLYESYIHPLTILSTLPSAGVGAILALLLFRIDLSVIALIAGILILVMPRLLNFIVAVYLIAIGVLGLVGNVVKW